MIPADNSSITYMKTTTGNLPGRSVFWIIILWASSSYSQERLPTSNDFVNWEIIPANPVALSPDRSVLAVCNVPNHLLEIFDVSEKMPTLISEIRTGLNPVSVRFLNDKEVWVVNKISDSISIIDLETEQVIRTVQTSDAPSDLVFAGSPLRAYVSCSTFNRVEVFDLQSGKRIDQIPIQGQRPRALAVSLDGAVVYAAIFESGNQTTLLARPFGTGFQPKGVVDFPDGPHGGLNPFPNKNNQFNPKIDLEKTQNQAPPPVSLIVRKNSQNQWVDDTGADWSEYVSGSKAAFSGRPTGWDVIDHDLACINTETHAVQYAEGLMNLCMGLSVNPVNGCVYVVGTEAMNEIRFEPVLKNQFVRVHLARWNPESGTKHILDLNPHLNYTATTFSETLRNQSIGDPRSLVWRRDGQIGFVCGLGSDNVIEINAEGKRTALIPTGSGPVGMTLDDNRNLLYVLNFFEGSISVIDTLSRSPISKVVFFDPTPESIRKGRTHLYNTHQTSGPGHVSCASCHADARFDRLAWDLGNPAGELTQIAPDKFNFGSSSVGEITHFHSMKGPMMTQTMQDIIGHEPFHWRGDRLGIEEFNPTFTDLQGRKEELTDQEMQELEDFLANITLPPNPYREKNNHLPDSINLEGHLALGRGSLPKGATLPNGNSNRGLELFMRSGEKGCIPCHALPTGLGSPMLFNGREWLGLFDGPMGEKHIALVSLDRSAGHSLKIPSLRNLYDKVGMTVTGRLSPTGFGFLHDGSVDSLVRFIQDGFDIQEDQDTADLVAFLLAFTGSDLPPGTLFIRDHPPGAPSKDSHAVVGNQLTVNKSVLEPALNSMIQIAINDWPRVELVARGRWKEESRGWFFDSLFDEWLPDRLSEPRLDTDALMNRISENHPFTFTIVPSGTGLRNGIDRDSDGFPDWTEIDSGSSPIDNESIPNLINISPDLTFNLSEEREVKLKIRPTSSNGFLQLTWETIPGRRYKVERKTSIKDSGWSPYHEVFDSNNLKTELLIDWSSLRPFQIFRVTSKEWNGNFFTGCIVVLSH